MPPLMGVGVDEVWVGMPAPARYANILSAFKAPIPITASQSAHIAQLGYEVLLPVPDEVPPAASSVNCALPAAPA